MVEQMNKQIDTPRKDRQLHKQADEQKSRPIQIFLIRRNNGTGGWLTKKNPVEPRKFTH